MAELTLRRPMNHPPPMPENRPWFVGMVHLEPLPGSPAYAGDFEAVIGRAAEDAISLAEGGVDAIMVENYHDAPFYKASLGPETVAALTRCALSVKQAADAVRGGISLGINALRNDGPAALAIALATGARFIRINVLTGAMVTDQGLIEGCAADLLRMKQQLGAEISILADVQVKHAAPLADLPREQAVADAVHRGRADALIASGTGTGQPTDPQQVEAYKVAAPGVPILVGSGTTVETVKTLGAHGYIVGTALKERGRISVDRVKAMREAIAGQ
ncbi:MAG: BtpA/SgcQ family protein [Bradymonadia bacterium]